MKRPKKNFGVFAGVSHLITVACLIFVAFQTQKCIQKYLKNPKSTEVSIELASKHPYPDITLCRSDFELYDKNLENCNLSGKSYIENFDWYGKCSDPEEVFKTMVGNPSEFIDMIALSSERNKFFDILLDITDLGNFYNIDESHFGRCFTIKIPKSLDSLSLMMVNFKRNARLIINTPKSWFGKNHVSIDSKIGFGKQARIVYEISDLLDFDGEKCKNYDKHKLECIHSLADEVSMSSLGCTTPYGNNKSLACKDKNLAEKAVAIFNDISWSEHNECCPQSCKYFMISKSNERSTKTENNATFITLSFTKFIRVSKSDYSYQGLELIAEVGGYVGLFLGISINQLTHLCRNSIISFKKTFTQLWK